ncbi:MAG TPA: hypothetical protein VK308_01125 [Pyrinomonadaceae bacterium]|nr:hypothetical protein [Pyrinomonadaceae bacterium]
MENKKLISPQDIQIQGVLDRYLRSRNSREDLALQDRHLDEDSLAAFTEGNLSEREAQPIVSHLVDCSFCRHVTAELIRLDSAFADEEVPVAVTENQPSKISEVLSNLFSRIFGANEGAVFAHQEKEEESEKAEDVEDNKK